jgi:O-antigen ligase
MTLRQASAAGVRAVAETPALVPGLLVIAVALVLITASGGYRPTAWYPAALLLLAALLTTALLARRSGAGIRREALLAVALLAAFTAWAYLSILWAGVEGDAWDGANRALLYLTVYALFALWTWSPRAAASLLAVFSVGTAGVLLASLAAAASADDPERYFSGGRLSEPIGYTNAVCALALAAFWPALALGSRRETHWVLRGALLASAGVLAELAVLTQSRASVVAAPIVLVIYLALARPRGRSLLFAALVAAVVAASLPWLLDVFAATDSSDRYSASVDRSLAAVGLSGGALAIAGAAAALLDRRVTLSPQSGARLEHAVGYGELVLLVAAVIGLGAAAAASPGRVENAWNEFTSVNAGHGGRGSSRFTGGLETSRYQAWRIAWHEVERDPLTGVGIDNYAVDFLRERETREVLTSPHSLELKVLSQTGAVGTALLLAFLVLAVRAAWRTSAERATYGGAIVVASLASFAYWLVHGSVDRFWEFPALAIPAFALLGLAASVDRQPASSTARPPARSLRLAAFFGLVVVAACAAATHVFPWLAARDVDRAASGWRSDPGAALVVLDRAAQLNPLSDRPDTAAGIVAARAGELDRARSSFTRALERNPSSWYARLELAALSSLAGQRDEALRLLEEARALNPREEGLGEVAARIRRGEQISPAVIDRLFPRYDARL